MCGIAGLLTAEGWSAEKLHEAAGRMSERMVHRGPDDRGTWADAEGGIGFGFRRLAIIDLSEHGRQPRTSASGRYTVVFNGEIYNYRALRTQLEGRGHGFKGESDTEVLVTAIGEWGIHRAVERLVGMFAFAAWDSARRELHLVRDRLGIKPLFVFAVPGLVSFSSELKGILASPRFGAEIDGAALASYFRYLYVPAPHSIFQRVTKLLPGHVLTIRDPRQALPAPVPYWTVEEAVASGEKEPFLGDEEETLAEADALLKEAVGIRMYADVPLGAFLSGGIDSSLVVATMQEQSHRPVRTFTVSFEESAYDEASHAARVASHLGTDHTTITLTAADGRQLIPKLPDMFDEPFASPSAIPNYLICQACRRSVTVALSGTGGDEVFGGYNRYVYGARFIPRIDTIPAVLRRAVAVTVNAMRKPLARPTSLSRSGVFDIGRKSARLEKVATLLAADSPSSMYRSLVSAWERPEQLLANGGQSAPDDRLQQLLTGRRGPRSFVETCMLADQVTYLADDQLAKIDRVSMAVSLEVRVPLLDHRLVEFSWRLPQEYKIRNFRGKWLLRRLAYRRIPPKLLDRPKMGLSVPLGRWLRGPLRDWGEDLLHGRNETPLLDSAAIHRAWNAFQRGDDARALGLWAVLMFHAWRQRWLA